MAEITPVQHPNRLILCFDGTGNSFQGTPGDTNIVKLYGMLGRNDMSQMHYYQPGIGTYPAEGPVNVSWFRTLLRKFEAVIDAALATSFDSHVIAGYKFIMRYYKPGDRIYIFGFSRGAFTARFLSRMISHVGLLSIGNEELIPFAYKVYQDYEQNRSGSTTQQGKQDLYMNSFKKHFCRTDLSKADSLNESGIKVHFLGLFDCVSSVGNLDIPFFQKTPPLPAVRGTARHIRHAVAIDERRVKFKAALFSQEPEQENEHIKEVWFPGNHGDVGGGWDLEPGKDKIAHKNTDDDHFQLSDIALKWMMDEIDHVEKHNEEGDRFAWDESLKKNFLNRFKDHQQEMIAARMHDTMKFNGGSSIFKVMLWNFMDWIPFVIKRWEYVESPRNSGSYAWDYIGWPPNCGGRRDIPSSALFHHSVIERMRLSPKKSKGDPKRYLPNNPLWVKLCQKHISRTSPPKVKNPDPRNLIELASQETFGEGAEHIRETQSLLNGRIHLVHEEKKTTGSVSFEKKKLVVTAEKWDRIYSLALDAP